NSRKNSVSEGHNIIILNVITFVELDLWR
ncbi:MAG: hypothetical protein ACJAZT_001786, partial [Gammaproteobacteria bacterium]